MTHSLTLKKSVYTALFVALITVGAFISIPVGPVPVVLQNMFVLLAALILGPVWGPACIGVYLILGVAGLPVFAGATAGLGRLFGPTGGYLLAYLPCALVTGAVSKALGPGLLRDCAAMLLGAVIIYAVGVPWLGHALGWDLSKAVAAGCYPFIIPDLIKIAAAAVLAGKIRPMAGFRS